MEDLGQTAAVTKPDTSYPYSVIATQPQHIVNAIHHYLKSVALNFVAFRLEKGQDITTQMLERLVEERR